MSKFTSGPWDFEHNGAGDDETACICVNFAGGGRYRGEIAYIQSSANIFGISMAEAEANARLIAAAPDLLAALEAVTGALDYLGDCSDGHVNPGVWHHADAQRVIDVAQSVIARARGEA